MTTFRECKDYWGWHFSNERNPAQAREMLAALVSCVATAAGRPVNDALECVKTLNDHWLTSLDDYAALSQAHRRELKLPLFLRVQLDRIVTVAAEAKSAAMSQASRTIIKSSSSTGGAVRAWLERRVKAPNADEVFSLFSNARLDDFFLLPMLDDTALRILGIPEKTLSESLSGEIDRLRKLSPYQMVGEWARVQGCEREAALLESQLVDAWVLRASKGADLAESLNLSLTHPLIEAVPPLTHFSSVLESFVWLHNTGFGKYSFHFARYNIPFYALPYVNFFILEEMGVSHDDSDLLAELQNLKSDPLFGAKALAYWLRDLELERYIGAFANAAIFSLDHLMQLATSALPAARSSNQATPPVLTELVAPLMRVITIPNDRNKLLAGMQELNEFHWYYRATSLLLYRIGFGRFAQLFTQYGISIDVISLLEDAHLAHMGIKLLSDRTALLAAIARVRQHLPHGLDNIVPVPEPVPASSGVVPPDTRSLDELLSYINLSTDETPKGGKKKHKPKAAAKVAKTKPAAAKNKQKGDKQSASAPSSPVIPAAKPIPELEAEIEADAEELALQGEEPQPERVAGGSGKRGGGGVAATLSASPTATAPAAVQPLTKAKGSMKSPLSLSDSSDGSAALSADKIASLLRASGGALSPDPNEGEVDPERQAEVDREVELFRRRLEAAVIHGRPRTKIFAL